MAKTPWSKVTERLPTPNKGTKVLVFNGYMGIAEYRWVRSTSYWYDCQGDQWTEVTHWMPLPERPA